MAINLVKNPSFETNTTYWTTEDSTIARSSARAAFGTWSLRSVANNSAGDAWYNDTSNTAGLNVTAGLVYYLSFSASSEASDSRSATQKVAWYNASNALISTSTAGFSDRLTVPSGTGWVRSKVVGFTAPAGATWARIKIEYNFGSTTNGLYIDGLVFTDGVHTSYFDGDTSGAFWNGTAHASTSTLPETSVPVADFTHSVNYETVTFTDTSTNNPTSWSWNFGDSTTSTIRNPVKTYASAGTYTVSLTATNEVGPHTVSKSVTAVATPPPMADPTAPHVVHWWDFDDGSVPAAFTIVSGSVTVSSGDSPGSITTSDGRTGTPTHYMQVGTTGTNRNDRVQTTVTIGELGGTIEFWRRAESESDYDFSKFFIDGVEKYSISGTSAWTKVSYPLTAGSHTLLWQYTSDSSVSTGIASQRITAITVANLVVGGSATGSWNAAGTATGTKPALAAHRLNLATNPSFEVDLGGWIGGYDTDDISSEIALTTEEAWTGTSCLAIYSDGVGEIVAQSPVGTAGMPVTPGTSYTASFYLKNTNETDFVTIFIQWWKADGSLTSKGMNVDGDYGHPDWHRYEVTAYAPAGAAYASIGYSDTSEEARTVYIDGVMFEGAEGYSGPYFDGDTSGASWTGTPHASASIMYVPQASIPDPSDPTIYWADFDSGLPDAFANVVGDVAIGEGDGPWTVTTQDGRTGVPTHYLQIGTYGSYQDDSVTVFANVGTGGGTLEFWRRVYTQHLYDFAEFYIDDVAQYPGWTINGVPQQASGNLPWEKLTYSLTEGVHKLRWRYISDHNYGDGFNGQRITALSITNTSWVLASEDPELGSGATSWDVAATATGEAPVIPPALGSAAGSWLSEGLATGSAPVIPFYSGYGTGSWTTSGSSTGRHTGSGSATGSWAVSGSAASKVTRRGTAAGAWDVYSSARGNKTLLPAEVPIDVSSDVRLEVQFTSGVWTDITGPTRTISINRADSAPGTLSAEVLDADLDPTKVGGIRTGRPVRVQVRDGATWYSLYTGTLSNVEAAYDPLAPTGKQVDIKFDATDNVTLLANRPEVRGVGTINELRWLVSGVPFTINGQSTSLSSGTVVATNESASLWDQILITRDSKLGYAWVDPENRLRVYDASAMETASRASLTPSIYRSVDTDFTLDQVINSVVVNWRRYNIGSETSADVPYGPYEDATSIADWGRRQATFTVQGATEVESNIIAFANDVLNRNKTAEVRAKAAVVPIVKAAHLTMARNIDLNSRVKVTLTDNTTIQEQRITGIVHTITPEGWIANYEMSKPAALTPPSATPSTPYTPIPPGTVGETELDEEILEEITGAAALAQQAIDDALEAIDIAETSAKVYYQASKPTNGKSGDIWFDTDAGYRIYIHNGSDFVDARDTGIAAAQSAASAAASQASAADAKAANALTTATNAQNAANGKNKVTYSLSPPGTAANTAGDIWFQRDSNGTITAQYEGTGGTSWASRTLNSAVIAGLDAGKITAGSTFTQSLNVKGLFTLGDASVNGTIESYNYDFAGTGVRISKSGVFAKGGTLTGSLIQTDSGSNGLKLTSGGLTAKDPSGNLKLSFDTASGNLILNGPVTTGGAITGASVTASATGVIQTESTGSRGIKLNSQGLVAYDSRTGSPTLGQAMLTIRTDLGSIAMKGDLTSGSNISGATITGTTMTSGIISGTYIAGYQAHFTSVEDVNLTSTNKPPLIVGDRYAKHLRIDGNEILSLSSSTAQKPLYLNLGGQTTITNLNVTGSANTNGLDAGNGNLVTNAAVRTPAISNPNGTLSINGGYQLNGGGTINGGPIISGTVKYQNRPSTASAVPNMRLDTTDGTIRVTTHNNSSLRYKTQVQELELTDSQMFDLRGVRYVLKDNPEAGEQWGFIAEEMDDLSLTPLVGYDDQDRPDEVDYSKVAVVQQGAIRWLRQKVTDLEQRLAVLEN